MSRAAGSGAKGARQPEPLACLCFRARLLGFLFEICAGPAGSGGCGAPRLSHSQSADTARGCISHTEVPNAGEQSSNWVWANLIVRVIL